MKRFDRSRVALFLAEGTAAVPQRRLEQTRREPEEDVEWIVDLLLDGLCSDERP